MTPLEEQVQKNTTSIKTISDSLIEYAKDTDLDKSNENISANTSDIEELRNNIGSLQTQINLQNRIEQMKDTNIVDAAKLDLLQYDGKRWSNIAANKVVTGLLGKLVDLQDVSINNLRNDNALAWDSELQKWTNKNLNTEIYDDVFLSKIKPDSTAYEVWFKESAIFGQEGFASGLTGFGGKIDKYGHAEFDSLTLRRFLEAPELKYNRVEIQLGDKWNAPGAGVIESVEQTGEYSGIITLKLEEGEYGAVSIGDLCMGIYHSEKTDENAENDEDDGRGNRKFAGFYTVYFEVTNILDTQNKKFGYTLRPVDEYWNMVFHPCAQMNFVAYGNKTNVDRQTSCYSTRTYTRYLVKQNTWDQKATNIAMQFGDLSNLIIFGYEMTGYSAYLNSVYFTGKITQVKPNGEEIKYANDRGPWEPDTHYDYYDRVSVLGYLWLCVNPNGSDTKPSEDNPDWLMQVSKGDPGAGMIVRRSEWKPGVEYRNDQDVPQSVSELRYLDIVLVKDLATTTGYKVYKCIYTKAPHISTNDNAPGTDGGVEYWEELAQNVGSIYTDLIIAKNAKLDFITGNSLRVGYQVDNTPNGFRVVAGITGEGGNDNNSVRIWAGTTEENRSKAPFLVRQDGRMVANNASIRGEIEALSGTIQSLEITGMLFGGTETNGMKLFSSYIKFKEGKREAIIGTPNSLGYSYFGSFKSNANDFSTAQINDGLYFNITGSLIRNMAIYGSGSLSLHGDVVGYKLSYATDPSENQILYLQYSRTIFIGSSARSMGYGLPYLDSVKTKLAIQTIEWAVPVTFVYNPRSNPKECYIWGRRNSDSDPDRPILYDNNGNRIERITVNVGDVIDFLLVYSQNKYYAILRSRSI